MTYLNHGYIDIFNHEIRNKSNNLMLVSKPEGISFIKDDIPNYNSAEFVNKILTKVQLDLNSRSPSYKDLKLKNSSLKFFTKLQPNYNGNLTQWKLEVKLRPSEDTAHIFIDNLNIIATFNNELNITAKEYILSKRITIEDNCSKLIKIPQHGFQISLNHSSGYNRFKTILITALYEDIANHMINELGKLTLNKWDVELGKTQLDFKNIINDNMKILIA